ncbi:MAG: Uma2 family endonuclease [Candidatus Eremiobacteraeota bacterium]|nr:Uma2 family endonuclease [Candidatus Eremiobacteraeota bacterium]
MDAPIPKRLSYADLDQLDPNQRWELIDGIAYAMSSPTMLHQLVIGELHVALRQQFKKGPCRVVLAPFDVLLSDHDVVQPDLLVSCSDKLEMAFHRGAPELAIEVLSKSTARHDRLRKLNLYARAGVQEYWIVTPDPFLLEILSLTPDGYLHKGTYSGTDRPRSAVFPELVLDLGELQSALPEPPPLPGEVRETEPVWAVLPG